MIAHLIERIKNQYNFIDTFCDDPHSKDFRIGRFIIYYDLCGVHTRVNRMHLCDGHHYSVSINKNLYVDQFEPDIITIGTKKWISEQKIFKK